MPIERMLIEHPETLLDNGLYAISKMYQLVPQQAPATVV